MNEIIITIPNKISSDIEGYKSLISIYQKVKKLDNCVIIFDFKYTSWFEANLAAIFGVIGDYASEQGNTLKLKDMRHTVRDVLLRNGFMAEYGMGKVVDYNGTTISYKKFDAEQGLKFSQYIKEELLSKPDFPSLSKLLAKSINESIYELFENARTHGECSHIYTCGQYYPQKQPARIDITIVDLGISIKRNINQYFKKSGKPSVTGPEAIVWAVQKGNTTKTGNISGGLGLDLVLQFLKLNNGKIQIVSSDGYWEFRNGETQMMVLDEVFNGTIVNIEFNLEDRNYYQLKEEISLDGIF